MANILGRAGAAAMQGARRSRTWTPAKVATEAWYRADAVVHAANAVETLVDKSGNGRDLQQPSSGAKPTLVTRAGRPALSLDGGDYMKGAFGVALPQPNTIYGVWEATAVATLQVIWDGDDNTNRHFFYTHATGPQLRAGAPNEVGGGAPAAGQIYASAVVYNGASSSLFGRSNFVTAEGTGNMGSAALDGLTIGCTNVLNLFLIGYVWEVIVCDGAHDAATRKLFGNYFAQRYSGLTVTT